MRKLTCALENWPLKSPFTITGHTVRSMDLLYVTIEQDGCLGRGEGAGVYYLGETGESMLDQARSVTKAVESGIDRLGLRSLLPAGGARNAIDCALWDLEAKCGYTSVWSLLGQAPRPLKTVNTVGIDTPERMAEQARAFGNPNLKVKLDGVDVLARIRAVRAARPEANLMVDVNQGWNFEQLHELAPSFADLGVQMIEQPLPRGEDAELENYDSPLPLCADESCLDTSELAEAARRYQMINIKLDKTGGLTEALELAQGARDQGLELMVGNMIGSSLSMAPAFLIGQYCSYVDLDGPTFLTADRPPGLVYSDGNVLPPSAGLWG